MLCVCQGTRHAHVSTMVSTHYACRMSLLYMYFSNDEYVDIYLVHALHVPNTSFFIFLIIFYIFLF